MGSTSLRQFSNGLSRAKTKLIVIMSRRLVDHLPRDPDILRQSRLLKHFADGYLLRSMHYYSRRGVLNVEPVETFLSRHPARSTAAAPGFQISIQSS